MPDGPEWVSDAEALELDLPPEAWPGFSTRRASATYTYRLYDTDGAERYTYRWKRI